MSNFLSTAVFVSYDPMFWVLAVIVLLIAGISKGGFGGGLVLIAVPLLSLKISPLVATALLLPVLCIMDFAALVVFWRKWHWPTVKLLLPASVLGIAIGTWVFTSLSVNGVKLIIGAVAIVFTLHYWGKTWLKMPETKPGKVIGFFCGTVAGFTSHVAHAGAPPYSIYMLPQRLPREQFVATTAIMFALINYVKLVPYSFTGQFTAQVLWTCLVLAPLAPVGVILGKILLKHVNEALFYQISYVFIFIAGLKLLGDGLGVF